MKRETLEKVKHTTLAHTIWTEKLTSKDLKTLGQTRQGEMPTWEIGLPDKKDEAGFVLKCSAVYYDIEDYQNDIKLLELE